MKRNLKPSISNDSSCWKRIKVKGLDCDGPLTCRRDTSPVSLKEKRNTYLNNAKTSEFAFFKKFKEDANLRFSSSLPRQKELRSKKFNSSDCFKERVSHVEKPCKDFTSNHLVENVTPVNSNSMHLRLGNSSRISDIFRRKREKLRQFTQNMSFYGTSESYEKGYGVISSLLSRLIPGSNQHKFNKKLEKQVQPERCFPRLDYEHHLNDSSSPCRLNKSRGRAFSHSDFSNNSNDDNFHGKYRTKESDSELGLYDQGESVYLRKQELEPHLLGWDTDTIKDESSSFQLTESNAFDEPSMLFADDHQPNLHMRFGAIALCSSLFPSSQERNLYSLPYSSLSSYQIHGLSRHYVEKEEDIDQCDNYVDDRGSHDFYCAQNAHWLMNNVLDDGHQHSSVESRCGSGVVFDFGWKYLSDSKEQCRTAYQFLEYPVDEMRPAATVKEECNNSSSDGVLVEYQPPLFFIQPEPLFQEGKAYTPYKLSWDAGRGEINVDIAELDYM